MLSLTALFLARKETALDRRPHYRQWRYLLTLVVALLAIGPPTSAAGQEAAVPDRPDANQVRRGAALFEGRVRFANGGPGCNACHEVTHEGVVGGGSLAADLTGSYSRLTGPGIQALLGRPPFPVMWRAFADHPLTEEEIAGLAAFLQQADAEQASQQPVRYGVRLLGAGIGGSVLLMGLYSMAWRGRRRDTVSRAIYDRQVKSS